MTRVSIQTLGCKTNQAESEGLGFGLRQAGLCLVPSESPADICIVNTCTVTGVADRKSRQMLRRARAANPGACVVAVGCYARRTSHELTSAGLADMVFDGQDEDGLLWSVVGLARRIDAGNCLPDGGVPRTRSFIKIQDGCSYNCAYCIVPSVRGNARSLDVNHVLYDVKNRVDAGYREFVLTGTNIGTYDNSGLRLDGLLTRVLKTQGVERLRLTSLQPAEITPALLEAWRDDRLCRHFHLSLQSGSESVLKRMRRRYTPAEYRNAVERIQNEIADCAITTDIVVGFPGETEEEHAESLHFCSEMGFAAIHVFPYSARPGTAGAEMQLQVDSKTRARRAHEFLALAGDMKRRYLQKFVGRNMPVLWEEQSFAAGGGTWSGLTGNYIRVVTRTAENLRNKITPAMLEKVSGSSMLGRLSQRVKVL